MVRRNIMVILVVALIVIIAGVMAILYFYYPNVLGIELPGYQFSQIVDNGNYYSLQAFNTSENNATFIIFSTSQYGRINWQSPTIAFMPEWHTFLPNAGTLVLNLGTLYFCFVAYQFNYPYMSNVNTTCNNIVAFNASSGELEGIRQYIIPLGSYPDFVLSDNNTVYFGTVSSLTNGDMNIEAYNLGDFFFGIHGIQLWNYTIANVSNGTWGTSYDAVALANGYLNVTFLMGNLAEQTFLLNVSTGELIH